MVIRVVPCARLDFSLTELNNFLHEFTDRSFCRFNFKFFVSSCILAISDPIDLQLAGDKFCFAFPSRNDTIINFFPSKFVIVSLLLLEIGAGHLKLASFKDDIKSEKKGRSADLTLFS